MDEEIEAIIEQEAGLVGRNGHDEESIEIVEEDRESDAYTEADEREERIELMNDAIDILVNESQDVSTEDISNDGWDHNYALTVVDNERIFPPTVAYSDPPYGDPRRRCTGFQG
jgi:hypothetical protein